MTDKIQQTQQSQLPPAPENLPDLRVDILLKVKKSILAEPHHFDMRWWIIAASTSNPDGSCGTTACIFGWAAIHLGLNKLGDNDKTWGEEALAQMLGLIGNGNSLAYSSEWPSEFRHRYVMACRNYDRKAIAQIAADRIDHLIATGE